MKVIVCDICKHEGKLTECNRYMNVKGKPYLRLDYCRGCKDKIPENIIEYKKLVAKLHDMPEDTYLNLPKGV